MKKKEDEYKHAFEIKDEKAHIIVYEPIITEEERAKRMQELKIAVQDFWKGYYRQQAIKEREKKKKNNKTDHIN